MDLTLQGRTAVVCASTSGLGLATAQALDRAGANIVISGRRTEKVARWTFSCTRCSVFSA